MKEFRHSFIDNEGIVYYGVRHGGSLFFPYSLLTQSGLLTYSLFHLPTYSSKKIRRCTLTFWTFERFLFFRSRNFEKISEKFRKFSKISRFFQKSAFGRLFTAYSLWLLSLLTLKKQWRIPARSPASKLNAPLRNAVKRCLGWEQFPRAHRLPDLFFGLNTDLGKT